MRKKARLTLRRIAYPLLLAVAFSVSAVLAEDANAVRKAADGRPTMQLRHGVCSWSTTNREGRVYWHVCPCLSGRHLRTALKCSIGA